MKKYTYYISWFFLICFWLFLISDTVLSALRPAPRFAATESGIFEVMNYGERILASFSFWTIWSNYLLAIFFTIVLSKPNKVINFNWWTVMTGFMTLTMILFWMGLAGIKAVGEGFQTKFVNDYSDPTRLIYTLILHLVSPGVIIGIWITKCGHQKLDKYEFQRFYLFAAIAFLVIYMIFVLTRGIIRTNNDKDIYTSFPYFFFAITIEKGFSMLSISITTIVLVVILILAGYFKINNAIANKKQVTELIKLNFVIPTIKTNKQASWVWWGMSIITSLVTLGLSIYFITTVKKFYQSVTPDDFKYNAINYLSWLLLLILLIVSALALFILLLLSLRFPKLKGSISTILMVIGSATVLFYGLGSIVLALFFWDFYSRNIKKETQSENKTQINS
ncbi:hypothetical protein [Spiroplasma alleghenense]|uniref:Uncharacterized protein n=1 Tax=Spiroplasma alleghenense TaxID=216931 RepID=A0A345Z297_9MOLU|nr:hypothetical protein [Spiroplasma alleghenense]AXK50726.1 hypothetical protein SALLE_v1c00500 [Spiroplasma alleghenense]